MPVSVPVSVILLTGSKRPKPWCPKAGADSASAPMTRPNRLSMKTPSGHGQETGNAQVGNCAPARREVVNWSNTKDSSERLGIALYCAASSPGRNAFKEPSDDSPNLDARRHCPTPRHGARDVAGARG